MGVLRHLESNLHTVVDVISDTTFLGLYIEQSVVALRDYSRSVAARQHLSCWWRV